jgi:hypothetical protein
LEKDGGAQFAKMGRGEVIPQNIKVIDQAFRYAAFVFLEHAVEVDNAKFFATLEDIPLLKIRVDKIQIVNSFQVIEDDNSACW